MHLINSKYRFVFLPVCMLTPDDTRNSHSYSSGHFIKIIGEKQRTMFLEDESTLRSHTQIAIDKGTHIISLSIAIGIHRNHKE